jgi:hypothetical protein
MRKRTPERKIGVRFSGVDRVDPGKTDSIQSCTSTTQARKMLAEFAVMREFPPSMQ